MIDKVPTDNTTGGISPNNNGAKLVEYRLGNSVTQGQTLTLKFDVIPDYFHIWIDPNPASVPYYNLVQFFPFGYVAGSAPIIQLGSGGYVKVPGRTQLIAFYANFGNSIINVVATMNCDFHIMPVNNS